LGTVSKALGLLELLRVAGSRLGLTEIARLADFDKATTRRLLVELAESGLVEQDPQDKSYDLGPALQTLGRAREQRFPLYRVIQPTVEALAETTGETVHATEYCAGWLASICIVESQKANRVFMDRGQKLPLHATASGLAFLAASPLTTVEALYAKPLAQFTVSTPIDRPALDTILAETRKRGFSLCDQLYEDGVSSVAAAIRGSTGAPIGTIAIAMPASRYTPETALDFGRLAVRAAGEVAARLGGKARATARQ
jgi:IclR family transcriptional regulator, acetate operon repressor